MKKYIYSLDTLQKQSDALGGWKNAPQNQYSISLHVSIFMDWSRTPNESITRWGIRVASFPAAVWEKQELTLIGQCV